MMNEFEMGRKVRCHNEAVEENAALTVSLDPCSKVTVGSALRYIQLLP
jgi:hypothetical protein